MTAFKDWNWLTQRSTRQLVAVSSVTAGVVLHTVSTLVVRGLAEPVTWIYAIGILCLIAAIARVAATITPPGREIPSPMCMIGRGGWEALFYVFGILVVVLLPTVPLVAVMRYVQLHPEAVLRTLPLASVVAGVAFGCVLSWFLRERINGPLDAIALIGSAATVFGGIGAGLAYLQIP